MLIVASVVMFSMLTGSNLFSYYLGTALTNDGVTDSTAQLEINIILNSFCLIVSIVGTFLADGLGRKLLAQISTVGCMVFLFLIGALTRYHGNSTNTSAIYANVAMMFLAQGSCSFGWTPLAIMCPPQVLSYSTRSIGMAWFVTWQSAILLIPIFAFPIAIEKIGWIIYMLNGGCNFLVILVIAFFWVETKGLSLEEASRGGVRIPVLGLSEGVELGIRGTLCRHWSGIAQPREELRHACREPPKSEGTRVSRARRQRTLR